MDKNYGMEIVRATEIAALNSARLQGLGSVDDILNSARETAFRTLNRIGIDGKVKNDRFSRRKNTVPFPDTIGSGGPKMDVMIVALEGLDAAASGKNNAMSCAAIANDGGIQSVPNLSMYKIVVNSDAYGVVDINQSPSINIKRVARALKKYTESTTVCILEQARHERLIHEVQTCGARIKLISEGEISGCLAALTNRKIDLFMGYGFAPEAVMVAAAIKCLGGYFEGRIFYENERDKDLARSHGIADFEKIYKVEDLIRTDEVSFAATGITDGEFLEGIQFTSGGAVTRSFVVRGETHTYRKLETTHFFDHKPIY